MNSLPSVAARVFDSARVANLQTYALAHPCAQAATALPAAHFLDVRFSRGSSAGIRVALSLNK